MSKKLVCVTLVAIMLMAAFPFFNNFTKGDNTSDVQPAVNTSTPQNRTSSYIPQTQTFSSYSNVSMTNQQAALSNDSLIQTMLNFNLSNPTVTAHFSLASNEPFVAVDGSSQSLTMRVNFTINFPNGSLAAPPYTTLEANLAPMHYFAINPPSGTWTITATLLDPGENTAWLQATTYNNGTKLCDRLEKEQINLVPGQALYYKIPLTPSDWFYLYANRLSGPYAEIHLRKNGTYNTIFKDYSPYSAASELFSSKTSPNGTYLLQVYSQGSSNMDFFIEIIKATGVTLQLNLDQGNLVKPVYSNDLEFFKSTITQNYEWIAFDGGLTDASSGKTARFLIIDPNLNTIYDGTANTIYDFQEKMLANNSIGTYYVGIFTTAYANANIKITSSSSVPTIQTARLDQNVTFTQTGQPYYLKIPQSQLYFLFAGYTFGSAYGIKYSIINPNITTAWSTQPYNSYALFPPTMPNVPFYIIKLQGQKDSSSLIHIRFQGSEDYNVQTPDCGNYVSRFTGDLILSNIIIRNSDYVFQHSGAMTGSSHVALFDSKYAQKTSFDFSSSQQTDFNAWRKGYENPPSGNWVQVFIDTGSQTIASVETSTLQMGDETQNIKTPYQFTQTSSWSDWWKVDIYKVTVNSPNWFGIITKEFPVNSTYGIHPSLSGWIYDSSLYPEQSGTIVDHYTTLGNSVWQNPKQGQWIFVLIGFQHSLKNDPLNCLVSFVGDADFHQDWPTNLSGNMYVTNAVINNIPSTITAFSNSTISNFSVNPKNEQISLTSSGISGTNGFCVVTIPKTLSVRPFTTLVDGNMVNDVLSMENSTHTSIYFAYPQATNQITLVSTPTLDHFVFNIIGSQTAGRSFSVTITAVDSLGNTFTSYNGAPTLTYSAGTISPTSATNGFSNGVWTGSITLTDASSSATVGVNDGSGHVGTSNSFAVTHASASNVLISPSATSVTAGATKTYSATATDQYGNTWDVTSSTTWTTSSGAGGSWNSNTYSTAKAGYWTITGTYASTAYTTSLTVNSANLDHFAFNPIGAQTTYSAFSITATALDLYGNTVSSYTGAPTLTISAGTINPSTMNAFISGIGSTVVTVTAGGSGVTIIATGGGHTGTSNSFVVTAGPTPTPTVTPIPTVTPTRTVKPTPVVAEFPSVIILTLFALACLATTLVYRKKQRHT